MEHFFTCAEFVSVKWVQVLSGFSDKIESMKTEISTTGGEKIVGELRQKQASERLLIICNGLRSSADHPATKAITQKLYEHGHAVFTFNFSDTHGMNLKQQVEDIAEIINHFDSYNEYILIGGSFGALSISIAASRSPKIKGLITVNGFFGSGRVSGHLLTKYLAFRTLTATSAKHRTFWKFYKREFHPEAITIPVLVIHSKADKHVSIRQSQDFYSRLAGPKEFRTLETSDHNLMPLTEVDPIVEIIDGWLAKTKAK